MSDEQVVYHFKPANEGEYIVGVPARDLTAADLQNIHPLSLRDAFAPGPSGKPMYVKVDAKHVHLTKEQAAATKPAPAATPPETAATDAATAPDKE